jgi:hypothetical protein
MGHPFPLARPWDRMKQTTERTNRGQEQEFRMTLKMIYEKDRALYPRREYSS